MSEKPLNQQVAEALGWTWKLSPHKTNRCRFLAPPTTMNLGSYDLDPILFDDASLGDIECDDSKRYIPRFSTDWGATGRFVAEYGISLEYNRTRKDWCAVSHDGEEVSEGFADDPLTAICTLLVNMGAAGKLESKP